MREDSDDQPPSPCKVSSLSGVVVSQVSCYQERGEGVVSTPSPCRVSSLSGVVVSQVSYNQGGGLREWEGAMLFNR